MNETKLGPRAGNRPLSKVTLTYLLIGLAVIPSSVTVGLWAISPRVKEGQLPVSIQLLGLPSEALYYGQPAEARDPLDDPRLAIANVGSQPITNFNVILNHSHEIRDPQLTLEPGETIVYRLKRFYNRAGIPFVPELSPVKHVRVFAKQADMTRASLHRPVAMSEYGQVLAPQPPANPEDHSPNDQTVKDHSPADDSSAKRP